MNEGMIVLVAMIGGLIGAILVRVWMNTPMERVSQQPSVTIVDEQPLPYWTAYGLPNYWPTYLSPYWMYGIPWYGPIGEGGSYYYPDRQRRPYNPSWHGGRQGHGPGYSGVAVGGGGGSGHGGGHGGGGGGGHH
jgi:uncharacterized membrane protein YgcG